MASTPNAGMTEGMVAEEDGSRVETEGNSTGSDHMGVSEEENMQVQLKAAGEAAASELPNLEQKPIARPATRTPIAQYA